MPSCAFCQHLVQCCFGCSQCEDPSWYFTSQHAQCALQSPSVSGQSLHCKRNFTCKNMLVMILQRALSCNRRTPKAEFLSSTSHWSLLTNQERGVSKKRPTHSRQLFKAGKGNSPQVAAFSPAAREAHVVTCLVEALN